MQGLLQVFFLILPIILAGIVMVASLSGKWLTFLKIPLDGYRTFKGKRIFGDNKTWLGVVVMSGVSAVTAFSLGKPAVIYAVLGLGYSVGELPNSFIKRRLGIAPGQLPQGKYKTLVKFIDLIDGIGVVAILMRLLLPVSWLEAGEAFILGVAVHYLLHELMVIMHLKRE